MLLESEGGIWAEADSRVFAMLMAPNRTARRLMAAERTKGVAFQRVAALRKRQDAQAAREHRRAERELEKELACGGTAGPWGASMRIRIPERATASPRPPNEAPVRPLRKPKTSPGVRRTRAYIAPIVDDHGRIALTFRVRYKGLKSKGWRPGLAADHVLYILREEALEGGDSDFTVVAVPISNMGVSADEIAGAWRALEAVEEGYRANAKVQYRIIWNLPHDLDLEQRREMVAAFCERTFGRLGLPYVAAVHAPDDKGDRRNYHAHICFSTRPCERTAPGEWVIAQEKVNGLTNPAGLKLMRALAAAHMNMTCAKAGKRVRFTHQTYEERGIDAERLEHVGPAAMAAHERGETVGVIERNNARIESNEAAEACRQAARHMAASSRHFELLRRRIALDVTRARIARGAEIAKTILDHVASIVPVIAPSSHVKAVANRISKVIGVRKCAETIAAVKPKRTTAKAILSTIPVRRRAADLFVRIGEVTKHADVERRSVIAARLKARSSALAAIREHVWPRRLGPMTAATDLARTAAELSIGGERRRKPAISTTTATALGTASFRIGSGLVDKAAGKALAPQRSKKATRAALVAAPLATGIDTGRRLAIDRERRTDDIAGMLATLDIRRVERDKENARERKRREETERQRQDEDRRRKEAELVQRRRDADVAEASRLIRTARSRPYRISGNTPTLDLSVFIGEDRALLKSVSGDAQLVKALEARFHADRRADQERAAAAAAERQQREFKEASSAPSVASQEEQERLWRLLDFDPWVTVEKDKPATISRGASEALGAGSDWLARDDVQQVLRGMADDQTEQIGGVLMDLAWHDGMLALRNGSAAMHAAVKRWAEDDAFIAFIGSVSPHLDRTSGPAMPITVRPEPATPPIGTSRGPRDGNDEKGRKPLPPGMYDHSTGRGG